MKEFEYIIKDENGIHARPAGLLVKQAKQFQSDITATKDDDSADAKKLFALMGLCVKAEDKIVIKADGPDELEAIQILEDFVKKNL
ncbi:HPr family phosphocarrier protein [Lacrimispora sp.]|uniref:HPr family phosphocarrier protein n=1 Tax=Lacrimispora sp. TaxID=2719234 RepID=UPI002896EF35|nr:HPr family phosphocarrier protein [Lacrimispora sp.]